MFSNDNTIWWADKIIVEVIGFFQVVNFQMQLEHNLKINNKFTFTFHSFISYFIDLS